MLLCQARMRTSYGGHERFQLARRPRRRGTALTLSPRVTYRHVSVSRVSRTDKLYMIAAPQVWGILLTFSHGVLRDNKDMAPQFISSLQTLNRRMTQVTKPTDPDGLVLEAWAQGYMVGSIIIMICITLSNIRRGVLLHKLILLEVPLHLISLP